MNNRDLKALYERYPSIRRAVNHQADTGSPTPYLDACIERSKASKRPAHGTEAPVIRACERLLRTHPSVVMWERRNNGGVAKGSHFIKFGAKGRADLFAIVETADHRLVHVEAEAKRGDGKGKMSEPQEAFGAMCKRVGIPYVVVTSAAELAEWLEEVIEPQQKEMK